MPRFRTMLAATLLTLFAFQVRAVQAKYAVQETKKVPIERLIENLTKEAEKNPAAKFSLARVHAMAFALKEKAAEVEVTKQDEPWYGYGQNPATFPVGATKDEGQLKAAKAHLDKAIELYQELAKSDPNNLTVRLGFAWCLDNAGKKDEAIAEYRKVVEQAWAKEKDYTAIGPSGNVLTAEAAGYLKPLLDADKDKTEIAELDERIKKMTNLPRAITPIAVPLRANLSAQDLEDRSAQVSFDADGSGERKQWSWITPNAAWLVYDHDGSGRVDSALQLFGNVTFWCFWDNGYAALRALDDNGDGQLTGRELEHLALWQDANGDGRVDPGEVKPLAAYGIVALSCHCEIDPRHPDRIVFSPHGVTFATGETRPTFDLLLHPVQK